MGGGEKEGGEDEQCHFTIPVRKDWAQGRWPALYVTSIIAGACSESWGLGSDIPVLSTEPGMS